MVVWLLHWAKRSDQMTCWVGHIDCSCWWEWGRPELDTDVVPNVRTGQHHQEFCTETAGLYHQQSYGSENLVGRWSKQVRGWILRGSSTDPCGIPVERNGIFLILSLHCSFKIPANPLLCEGGLKGVLKGEHDDVAAHSVKGCWQWDLWVWKWSLWGWTVGLEGSSMWSSSTDGTELLGCKQIALYSNEEWNEFPCTGK